jgi:general stress protein YciG
MPTRQQEATSGRCKAKTKAGSPCAAPAIKGGQFCSLHSDPERAAQLGRKGGLGNRHTYQNDGNEVTAPQNASDVKNLLADAMAEIRTGKMDPKLGTTLGYLGTSLLRAIETADIEQRLAKLEATSELENQN